MARDCGREISQDVEVLQVAGSGDRQQARRGQLPVGAAVAKADLTPLHPRAQRTLRAVIGRLDPLVFEEREQPLVVYEQGGGEIADFAVGAVQMPLSQGENPFLDGERAQQQLGPVDLAAAELVPEPEEPGMLGQGVAAEPLHGTAFGELGDPQQIAFQMSPAELRCARMILQIRAETVAAEDALEDSAQQTGQHFAAARGGHRIDPVARRHESPQETLAAVGPPARLIDVQHRFILQAPFQFLARGGDRLAGFFPTLLRAAQTDLDPQNLPQQRFHHPPWHPADHRQIGDERGQLRTELPGRCLRHRRPRALAAGRALDPRALILDDPSLDGRQLSHLMPPHRADRLHLLDLLGQRTPAVAAALRQHGPNLVDSFQRHPGPMRSAMAGLPTRLPPTLLAPAPLAWFPGQSVGGRRLGGVGGVPLVQRQLPLQIRDLLLLLGDLLLLFGDLLTELVQLTLLPLELALEFFPAGRLRGRRSIRPGLLVAAASRIHPAYGKPFGEIWPAQKWRSRLNRSPPAPQNYTETLSLPELLLRNIVEAQIKRWA